MNIPEFFVKRWEAELPAFGRVLCAIPEDKHSYRPHEASKNAAELAWQLAEEQRALTGLFTRGEASMDARPHPKTVKEIVAAWDQATADLRKELKKLDEKTYAAPASFIFGGHNVWTDTVGGILWGFLFDMVHHRGQISTYLRPMGAKVPAIYGPSADDTGA